MEDVGVGVRADWLPCDGGACAMRVASWCAVVSVLRCVLGVLVYERGDVDFFFWD